MSVTEPPQRVAVSGEAVAGPAHPATAAVVEPGAPVAPQIHSEFLHFALRNWKFVVGASVVLGCLVVALVGPLLQASRQLGQGDHRALELAGEDLQAT